MAFKVKRFISPLHAEKDSKESVVKKPKVAEDIK